MPRSTRSLVLRLSASVATSKRAIVSVGSGEMETPRRTFNVAETTEASSCVRSKVKNPLDVLGVLARNPAK